MGSVENKTLTGTIANERHVMQDQVRPATAGLAKDLSVRSVRATIVDVPTVRKHKLSSLSVTAQSYVIVQVQLANGVEGIGESSTLGGPRWSEESVETIKAVIDAHLAPALIGARADRFEQTGVLMDAAAKRNNNAKAALDTALMDAVGRTLGLPGGVSGVVSAARAAA